MKKYMRSLSEFIKMLSIILVFVCGFLNYKIEGAEKTTYDPTPIEGYHKEKTGKWEPCEHEFNPEGNFSQSAWVYSDCDTFNPTENALLNSVHAVSKDSDRKIEVVSREIKEYSVSELLKQQKYSLYNNGKKVFTKQLVVGIKNAENKSVAYVPLAVPYICNHEDSHKSCNAFYSRYVMYVWCDELNTWIMVGNKHYWYGCALGDVGKPVLNKLTYEHKIYEYRIISDTQTVKFDSNIDDDYDETTAKITDSTLSNMPLQFKSTYNVDSYIPDETPTREGYTFVCWYTAGGKRYMPGDRYSHDTSVADKGTVYLYAKWTANTYKISYSLGGGTHGTYHPDSAAYNESFTISNPSRNGYKFKGWKITGMTNSMHTIDGVSGISGTSYSGATGTKFKNLRNISGTVTFTAEWESTSTTPPKKTTAPLASYKIKYNLNGGTHGASHPDSAGMTEKITISNPSKTGCKFKGWDITGAGKNYLIGASYPYVTSLTGVTETTFSQMGADGSTVTFTAAWEKIKYSLQIDYNGGTQNTSVTNTNSSALFAQKAGSYTDIETGKEITVAVPVKTGYKFTGWKIEGYENTYDEQLWTSFRSPNWQHMDDIVSSGIITTDFCKDSSKNTYALQNLRSTAGTVKLTAQWKPVNYNVSVNYNGGSHNVSNDNASALLLSQTADYVAAYDKEMSLPVPQREGYTFTGWKIENYDSNSSGQLWTSLKTPNWQQIKNIVSSGLITASCCKDASKKMFALKNLRSTAGTVTLTAQWESEGYTLSVDLNGGNAAPEAFGSSSTVIVNGAGEYDIPDKKEITVTVPVRTGYIFTGWKIEGYDDESSTQLWTSLKTPNWQSIKNAVSDKGIITAACCKDTLKNTFALKDLLSAPGTVKLTAQWKSTDYIIITDYNGGKSQNAAYNGDEYSQEDEGEFPLYYDDILDIEVPVRDGYMFTGWKIENYDSAGSEQIYYGGTWKSVAETAEDGTIPSGCGYEESGQWYRIKSLSSTGNEVTLTAQWEKKNFAIFLDAADSPDEDGVPLNKDYYYDWSGQLENLPDYPSADGIWYKGSINVRAYAECGYSPLAKTGLEVMRYGAQNTLSIENAGKSVTGRWNVLAAPYDEESYTEYSDTGRITVTASAVNADGDTVQTQKYYYADSNAPIIYHTGVVAITESDRYMLTAKDPQSGLSHIDLERYSEETDTWEVINEKDVRSYNPDYTQEECLEKGYFITTKENFTYYTPKLPYNIRTKYRIAVYDAVENVRYSREFTVAEDLYYYAQIRRTNGATAESGETFEIKKASFDNLWIDGHTAGYADKIIYVLPKQFSLDDDAHRQIAKEEIASYTAIPSAERQEYTDNYDSYNIYETVNLVNDVTGCAADTFSLLMDQDSMQTGETYTIESYAVRGDTDYKKQVFPVKYVMYDKAYRVMINQRWLPPERICFHWDVLNYLIYGKSGEQLEREWDAAHPGLPLN